MNSCCPASMTGLIRPSGKWEAKGGTRDGLPVAELLLLLVRPGGAVSGAIEQREEGLLGAAKVRSWLKGHFDEDSGGIELEQTEPSGRQPTRWCARYDISSDRIVGGRWSGQRTGWFRAARVVSNLGLVEHATDQATKRQSVESDRARSLLVRTEAAQRATLALARTLDPECASLAALSPGPQPMRRSFSPLSPLSPSGWRLPKEEARGAAEKESTALDQVFSSSLREWGVPKEIAPQPQPQPQPQPTTQLSPRAPMAPTAVTALEALEALEVLQTNCGSRTLSASPSASSVSTGTQVSPSRSLFRGKRSASASATASPPPSRPAGRNGAEASAAAQLETRPQPSLVSAVQDQQGGLLAPLLSAMGLEQYSAIIVEQEGYQFVEDVLLARCPYEVCYRGCVATLRCIAGHLQPGVCEPRRILVAEAHREVAAHSLGGCRWSVKLTWRGGGGGGAHAVSPHTVLQSSTPSPPPPASSARRSAGCREG